MCCWNRGPISQVSSSARTSLSGPFKGKVFKDVEYAQLDWLADSRAIVVGGRYLLPFGLYNERLGPIWIRNLQDFPYTASIGTRTSGAGDGLMLRGVAGADRAGQRAILSIFFGS